MSRCRFYGVGRRAPRFVRFGVDDDDPPGRAIPPGLRLGEPIITGGKAIVRAREEALERVAEYDSLTQFPSRSVFVKRLQQWVDSRRTGAVLMFDVDRFREVNRALGHRRGDELLRQLGGRLRDAFPLGRLALLGAGVFVALVDAPDESQVCASARTLVEGLCRPVVLEDVVVPLEVRIGIAMFGEHGGEPDALLAHSDIALGKAKQSGDAISVYSPDDDASCGERLALLADVRQAIDDASLSLHYQPIVDLRTQDAVAVEALTRWHHPRLGLVSPSDFIPLIEQTSLIGPFTDWVVDAALRQAHEWRRGGRPIDVAVNVSARNLSDPALLPGIKGRLRSLGLPGQALIIEVTEGAMMMQVERSLATLRGLRRLGVRIALDDFGAGHSSFSCLNLVEVDEVKLDRSFVSGAARRHNGAAMLRSFIDLGHNLGLVVTAGGVEDANTLRLLSALGCDRAQGNHIGSPREAAWWSGFRRRTRPHTLTT